jgi:hypothetical protein
VKSATITTEALETLVMQFVRAFDGCDDDSPVSIVEVGPLVYEVTTFDGEHRTSRFEITATGYVLSGAGTQRCAECGEELGRGAYWDEDRLGNDVLIGCSLCVAHEERHAAESRVDRAVDAREMRAEGLR